MNGHTQPVRVTPGDRWFPSLNVAFQTLGLSSGAHNYRRARQGKAIGGYLFYPVDTRPAEESGGCPCCGSLTVTLRSDGGECGACEFTWTTVEGRLSRTSERAITAHRQAMDRRPGRQLQRMKISGQR
jgi:hypothetical protein